ncbi:MAG: hypothetical protein GDA38_08900 [Hormoscilla sp. SP12CHS1]|nr:hypothetical protein [Hormoscilla sp. SP12CHS1]
MGLTTAPVNAWFLAWVERGLGNMGADGRAVGWQRGGRWHTWENLTFGLAAPTGHLPGVPALGSFRGGVRR